MQRQAMGVALHIVLLPFELLHSTIDSYDADFDESALPVIYQRLPLRVHPMTRGKYDDTYLFANSCP